MWQRASKHSDILHSLHSVTFAHLMKSDRHERNNLFKTTRLRKSVVSAVCFVSAINSDLSSEPHCTLWNKNTAYLEKRLSSLTCNIIRTLIKFYIDFIITTNILRNVSVTNHYAVEGRVLRCCIYQDLRLWNTHFPLTASHNWQN